MSTKTDVLSSMRSAVCAAVLTIVASAALAQPVQSPLLSLTSATRSTKATTATFGNDSSTQIGTDTATSQQVGREANPCSANSDADQGIASASASADPPAVNEATVGLSFTINVQADGGKRLGQAMQPPCAAQSDQHTTATAEAQASIDLTVTMGPDAEATTYELRLKDPTGSISDNTKVFYRILDHTGTERNFGADPSALDPPFLFQGGPGMSVGIQLELSAKVTDQGFANQRAGGTFGLVFEIMPAALSDAALQLGTVRIIGGEKVGADDYPAVGAVLLRDKVHCSGTLVAPSTVLTAAHCVVNRAVAQMKFVLGPSIGEARIVEDVESGIFPKGTQADGHLRYVRATRNADIALLYLKAPIDRNRFAPAPLYDGRSPTFSEFTKQDGRTAFVGFGFSDDEAGVIALGEKRLATMKIRSATPESFRYGDDQLNTCYGDSGGPSFFAVDKASRITGVVSWGDSQCKSFGVNMRTDRYLAWITPRLK